MSSGKTSQGVSGLIDSPQSPYATERLGSRRARPKRDRVPQCLVSTPVSAIWLPLLTQQIPALLNGRASWPSEGYAPFVRVVSMAQGHRVPRVRRLVKETECVTPRRRTNCYCPVTLFSALRTCTRHRSLYLRIACKQDSTDIFFVATPTLSCKPSTFAAPSVTFWCSIQILQHPNSRHHHPPHRQLPFHRQRNHNPQRRRHAGDSTANTPFPRPPPPHPAPTAPLR